MQSAPPFPPDFPPPEFSGFPPDSAPVAPLAVRRFEFRGSAGEFFLIWLVNWLLTIATLGLYSPWAKVRTRRYFYGGAFLGGANFDYHASPWSILLARILILAFISGSGALVVYFFRGEFTLESDTLEDSVHFALIALLLPWAVVRGAAFNARYSSYRGARFAFKKETAAAYGIFAPFILLFILSAYGAYFSARDVPLSVAAGDGVGDFFTAQFVAIFLCIAVGSPLLMRAWHEFKAGNHSLGPVQFRLQKPPLLAYFIAFWGIPIYAVVVWGIPFLAVALLASGALFADESAPAVAVVLSASSVFVIMLLVINFMRAKLFHIFWNHLRFEVDGESGAFRADFTLREFAVNILCVNHVLTVLSLGMLYPWTQVRRARFLAGRMSLETTPAALDKIPGLRSGDESALGEEFEAAEGFDFDVGLV